MGKLEKLKCHGFGSGRGPTDQWDSVEPRNRLRPTPGGVVNAGSSCVSHLKFVEL